MPSAPPPVKPAQDQSVCNCDDPIINTFATLVAEVATEGPTKRISGLIRWLGEHGFEIRLNGQNARKLVTTLPCATCDDRFVRPWVELVSDLADTAPRFVIQRDLKALDDLGFRVKLVYPKEGSRP